MKTAKQIDKLIAEAFTKAGETAAHVNNKLPPEKERGLDCGFAWVVCKPGGSRLALALKRVGATVHHGGGVMLWDPGKAPTQSINPKQAGARGFIQHLKANLDGDEYAELYYGSRLD